jgi:hypothetical protein
MDLPSFPHPTLPFCSVAEDENHTPRYGGERFLEKPNKQAVFPQVNRIIHSLR